MDVDLVGDFLPIINDGGTTRLELYMLGFSVLCICISSFALLANIFSFDAISTLAIIGREVPRIKLGTAVTPTYPRHPTAIAQQALTTAAATNNRFTLGIGLS